ncbi:MAG: right-handed parallel beta-helix repeat-containing protein [bacterium]|nr:right-handed parallel beta-helix repeat-containing protein [bacterium]
MKRLFIFILIAGSSSIANATNVSGSISTNTVWDNAGSPYIVTDNIGIDAGVRLDIQPGVEIRLDSAKNIEVYGTLSAIGTNADSIIITKNGTGGWLFLRVVPTSICSLKYCRIEYAGPDHAAIYNESDLYIGYCNVSNNSGGGIYNPIGSVIITNNTFSDNSSCNVGGAICNVNTATITNNIIYHNRGSGAGIYNEGAALISDNTITYNWAPSGGHGGGICSWGGTVSIFNNNISNNSADSGDGGGIMNQNCSAIIIGNIISNNSSAEAGAISNHGAYGNAIITHNTISNNTGASGSIINCGGEVKIKYNTITDNNSASGAIISSSGSNTLVRTNNIYPGIFALFDSDTNNVDARYNYWNTTDIDTINAKIIDHYDDSYYGIVFYQPFLGTTFNDTTAPLPPLSLTATGAKANDSVFVVNWTNPTDSSGISEYYYKLGTAPVSDFDKSGILHYPPDTISTNQEDSLFVWLVDSSGNLNYQNSAALRLTGVEEQTPVVSDQCSVTAKPNLFGTSTAISYELPAKSKVSLNVYDISGSCVKTLMDGEKPAGTYTTILNAKGLKAGIYFVKLTAGTFKSTQKLVLMK